MERAHYGTETHGYGQEAERRNKGYPRPESLPEWQDRAEEMAYDLII